MSNDQAPPASEKAEQAVIGAVLIRPDLFRMLCTELQTDDFFWPVHREIWESMRRIADRRTGIDVVSVHDDMTTRSMGRMLKDGSSYLVKCATDTPTAEHGVFYARLVREKASLRRLIAVCGEVSSTARGDLGSYSEFVRDAIGRLSNTVLPGGGAKSQSLEEIFDELMNDLERSERGEMVARVPTGMPKLDKILQGGLAMEHLVVPMGATSLGKSSWAFQVGFRGARDRRIPALMFSLEMSKKEVFIKGAATLEKVDSELFAARTPETVGSPDENRERWKTLHRAGTSAATLSRLVRIEEHRHIDQICAVSHAWRAENEGPAVIIVDHVQKVVGHRPKGSNRQEEVWGVARSLKDLAKDLKVPVISPGQLDNDAVKEKRPPRLGDLRDSKAVEHEADVVIGLHRERNAAANTIQLWVLKHRGGRIGRCTVAWNGPWQGFDEPTVEVERLIEEDEDR